MRLPAPHRNVDVQIQARGLVLGPRQRLAAHREARYFAAQFPGLGAILQVRLFSVPGGPARPECGCLLHARVGRARLAVIATGIDSDLARAMRSAFLELVRGTRAALHSVAGVTRPSAARAWPAAT